ncbi:hypothetical protein [Natronosalvus rutilus]|uniref:Uncharacterized protein n=1 Tax=Natronosalvus rutilus TaxID=2953753 RepID=A0A9E7NC79_9EURY|nr:hypothetical protein [Natronosalvus rutilus]UTF54275.1 hypothetical protein NGM29_03050 [Natronosalvus rutilus]
MQRRLVLGGILACLSLGPGCLSSADEAENEPATVEDPPEWLRERGRCEDEWAWGALELSRTDTESRYGTATVAYEFLTEESKQLVRFAIHNDGAEACTQTGGSAFQTLLSDVRDLAYRPYQEEHGKRPRVFAIRTSEAAFRIERLEAFDAVLV